MIEQDGSRATIVSINAYKNMDNPGSLTVRVSRFSGMRSLEDTNVTLDWREKEEVIDGVKFEYNWFQAIGNEFNFVHHRHPDDIYTATKDGDNYIITWDGGWIDYKADLAEFIKNGKWIVINGGKDKMLKD